MVPSPSSRTKIFSGRSMATLAFASIRSVPALTAKDQELCPGHRHSYFLRFCTVVDERSIISKANGSRIVVSTPRCMTILRNTIAICCWRSIRMPSKIRALCITGVIEP